MSANLKTSKCCVANDVYKAVKPYFLPNPIRWMRYKRLIQLAKAKGYLITSLIDWYNNHLNSKKKVLILRHDVDKDIRNAARLHQIEQFLGVYASYYFRWNTIHPTLIRNIKAHGSEVGLHFETLSSYIIENNIRSREVITEELLEKCRHLLKKEIQLFKSKFGDVKTVAAHGNSRVNQFIGISNAILLESQNLNEYGILTHAYDRDILNRFDVYISDGGIFTPITRGIDPIQAVNKEIQAIYYLTHPRHYSFTLSSSLKGLARVLKIYDKLYLARSQM